MRFIKHAQQLGFSLKWIKDLLALKVDPSTTRTEVRERTLAKIANIDEKMEALRAMKKDLTSLNAEPGTFC